MCNHISSGLQISSHCNWIMCSSHRVEPCDSMRACARVETRRRVEMCNQMTDSKTHFVRYDLNSIVYSSHRVEMQRVILCVHVIESRRAVELRCIIK